MLFDVRCSMCVVVVLCSFVFNYNYLLYVMCYVGVCCVLCVVRCLLRVVRCLLCAVG